MRAPIGKKQGGEHPHVSDQHTADQQDPAELGVRERTGTSIVAVERGEEVLVEFGPDFRFHPEDAVYVCGSSRAVRRFQEVFERE